MTLRKVLVTNVQINGDANTEDPEETDEDRVEPGAAPSGSMYITLALDDVSSERLVFAAEHGTVWLSIEPKDAPEGPTKIVNLDNVFGN